MGNKASIICHRYDNHGVKFPYCVKCGSNDPLSECLVVLFEVPFMPPSSNNCYVTIWKKKMTVLTKEAQAFKKRVLTEIVPEHLPEISLLDRKAVYDIHYRFYFPKDDVMTKSFGQKNGADSPYKKMDLENRLKLLSDVVSTAIGIDDSQFFSGHQSKLNCELVGGTPQVHIFLRKTERKEFGFP